MHQRKSKKIIIYIFLLLILGSINNLNLINSFKFDKIKNIKVSGLKETDNEIILKSLENLDLRNIFLINNYEISKIVSSFSMVEKFKIFKEYPSSLSVEIKKTDFLARINIDDNILIIGSNGKLLENRSLEKNLPFIFGKPNITEFLKFKSKLDISQIDYNKIKNFYFFPSKRWDIQLKNNIVLKLPREKLSDSLDDAFEFINNESFNNTKVLDLRIKNRLILND